MLVSHWCVHTYTLNLCLFEERSVCVNVCSSRLINLVFEPETKTLLFPAHDKRAEKTHFLWVSASFILFLWCIPTLYIVLNIYEAISQVFDPGIHTPWHVRLHDRGPSWGDACKSEQQSVSHSNQLHVLDRKNEKNQKTLYHLVTSSLMAEVPVFFRLMCLFVCFGMVPFTFIFFILKLNSVFFRDPLSDPVNE